LVPIESGENAYMYVISYCNFDPMILSCLHRFGDTATYWLKSAHFSCPSITAKGELLVLFFDNESRAIAVKTARCRCKLRYVSKFTAASRRSPCDIATKEFLLSCFFPNF